MNDDANKLVAIRAEIAREERHLANLDAERTRIRARLEGLKARLDEVSSTGRCACASVAGVPTEAAPITPRAKLKLFCSLFRGRADLFPVKFFSKKTGKAGYAPECANKFVPGICRLPRIKCAECRNQAFLPVDDRAVLGHLQGRHIMGIYPLLKDETCWFLAVDFDKASWREDVSAFRQTCDEVGVPCALERSQSGNGAHVWFFFQSPVSAAAARQMGCHLMTETMAHRHQLSMESYDRLFPSQDRLPRRGFGNLIALPLQYQARERGNTVFLDENLEPYRDQWSYLASVSPLCVSSVESIAAEATRRRQVVGIRWSGSGDGDDDAQAPWQRPPSGRREPAKIPGPLPARLRAVLAQKVFIETADLSSPLINRIKRLAAFQNPEFYSRQRMRLSTALTPRVIARAEEDGQHLALPRGCLAHLQALLEQHGVELDLRDERHIGKAVEFVFKGDLTALQKRTADALLLEDMGILVAPPGFGKTVLGAYVVAKRRCSTLVLVHRQPLMDQWVAQLSLFLGINEKDVGRLGGGRKRPNGRLDVATFQSLVRKERVADVVAEYGQVIVDECHHVPAVSFERVLSEVKARYVTGLTATPRRRDGHHPILEMQLGPPRSTVSSRVQAANRPFRHRLVIRETAFRLPDGWRDVGIQEIYRALAADEARNELILNDVITAIEAGRRPLVLTERKDQLAFLAERLSGFVRRLVVCQGGMGAEKRKEVNRQLSAIPDDQERLVLATGRYVGEGLDDPRLDTLFLTMPVAWKGTVTQYAGRLHRLRGDKREARIYDYVDRDVPVLARMFGKRLRAYRAMGYVLVDLPRDADTAKNEQPMLEGLESAQ
ncbi:MAG: DEAD/DEAH box helicase [Nitrococcus mobilis]|nr:DEAD/DEAH box helicase [Nitrococcus mobilis]